MTICANFSRGSAAKGHRFLGAQHLITQHMETVVVTVQWRCVITTNISDTLLPPGLGLAPSKYGSDRVYNILNSNYRQKATILFNHSIEEKGFISSIPNTEKSLQDGNSPRSDHTPNVNIVGSILVGRRFRWSGWAPSGAF